MNCDHILKKATKVSENPIIAPNLKEKKLLSSLHIKSALASLPTLLLHVEDIDTDTKTILFEI